VLLVDVYIYCYADYCSMTNLGCASGGTDPAGSTESEARSAGLRLLARMIARACAKGSLPHETDSGIDRSLDVRSERTIANGQDGISQR
jgi:hypothetical protein